MYHVYSGPPADENIITIMEHLISKYKRIPEPEEILAEAESGTQPHLQDRFDWTKPQAFRLKQAYDLVELQAGLVFELNG
jgi:hypothetical protein